MRSVLDILKFGPKSLGDKSFWRFGHDGCVPLTSIAIGSESISSQDGDHYFLLPHSVQRKLEFNRQIGSSINFSSIARFKPTAF